MTHLPRSVPLRALLALTGLLLAALLGTSPGSHGVSGAAALGVTPSFAFSGTAYGSEVKVGSSVKSGPTALTTLGCSTVPDRTSTNNTALIDLGAGGTSLGRAGTTVNTVNAAIVDGLHRTKADSDVQFVKVLDDAITADALHATAKAYSNATGDGSTTFLNLTILGRPVDANPAPNTKISLGTLGYVVLNEQQFVWNKPVATMTVTAMRVHLVDQPGLATPIDIRIGYAQAKIDGPIAAVMEGYAYGTNVNLLGGVIKSGKTSWIGLPCHGTKGVVRTATVASLALPDLLATGTNESSVVGTITSIGSTATVTNRIQGINLFNGRITADVIKTELSGQRAEGGDQVLTDSSEFVNLTIDGQSFGGTPPKNTKIEVPGLGTIYLHRVVKLASGITEVRSIELALGTQMGQLPIGTRVKVGVVGLSLHE